MNNVLKLVRPRWKPLKITVRHSPYPVPFKHFLENRPGTQYSILPNGLIVATEERSSYYVSCGLYIDGGSRYESDPENGIAHFFEHLAFKGTRCRDKLTLQQQMLCLGAKFTCSTTRELATYGFECLCQDTPQALSLLADCVFNRAFTAEEVEIQKKLVYMEMLEHDRDSNSVLFDYLHATAFQGTPLGHSVMGPSTNLYNFDYQNVRRYLERVFDPTRTVLAAAGGLKHEQMVELASVYLCGIQPNKCTDSGVYRYTGSDVRYRDDTMPLANVAIAVEGPSLCNEDNLVMEVARHILGAWDISQPGGEGVAPFVAHEASINRLCHAYKAFNINYKDTGLWGVQFITDVDHLDGMVLSLQEHMVYLCVAVTEAEVARGKRLLKTQLLSKVQGLRGVREDIGQHTLYLGFRPSLVEKLDTIDTITAADVRHVCEKYLYDRCPAVAAIGPVEALLDYNRIRGGMYWLRF